jgi:catechol 2,3-dioxygenase-like lactoylglutathione lyase family enzyme
MRLRQIAIACTDVNAVAADLATVFGLKIAYRDPHIIHYGLENAILPAGAAFIELLAPVRPDASAARFLARRGGDAGYMLIFQVGDVSAERARIAALGVRVVDDLDNPDYRAAHFHPSDFGGVLASVDEQTTVADHLDPHGDWRPAGRDWRDARTAGVLDLTGVTLTSSDPEGLAARFSELLARPLADASTLPLDRGALRFAAGEASGTAISGIELQVADPEAAMARALGANLDLTPEGVRIGGVLFHARG